MFCTHCGKESTDLNAFCTECGAPAQPVDPPPVVTQRVSLNNERTRRKLLVVAGVAAALVLAVSLGILLMLYHAASTYSAMMEIDDERWFSAETVFSANFSEAMPLRGPCPKPDSPDFDRRVRGKVCSIIIACGNGNSYLFVGWQIKKGVRQAGTNVTGAVQDIARRWEPLSGPAGTFFAHGSCFDPVAYFHGSGPNLGGGEQDVASSQPVEDTTPQQQATTEGLVAQPQGQKQTELPQRNPPSPAGRSGDAHTPRFSGSWYGKCNHRDTNQVTNVSIRIAEDPATDLLTGTLIFDAGESKSSGSCSLTGTYSAKSKFMLLNLGSCHGDPPDYLNGQIGFSSVDRNDNRLVGVVSSHNAILDISRLGR
jgi:hypothetical protein